MKQKLVGRSTYRLFSIILFVSLLLSNFQAYDVVPVHAQEASTATPTPAAIATSQPGATLQNSKRSSEPIPSQIIIRFASKASENEKKAFVNGRGGTIVERIDALHIIIIRIPSNAQGQPSPRSSIVESIEQDYYIDALDEMIIPNDPRYAEQWALPAIGAPSAWGQMPADAPKVTVAVIDSGICASHPDLTGRILDGWDFIEGDAVPQDDFGHGCSVSGVIAANMNDGIGIAGVAPNAQIMPLRVLNASGVGSYSDVAAAIVYAADNGAQVINLSLGGSNPSSTLENAVNYAITKGVVVVAAAGNNGTEGALYPAAYPDVIAVGSVDPNLEHSSFSNYGSQIDIWAPGRDILTTKRDGSYGLVSGTSFATPYVAGAEAYEFSKGNYLELGGRILLFEQQEVALATPIVISSTPEQPVVTPTNSSSSHYLVLNISGKIYAYSLDTGDYIELGDIPVATEEIFPQNKYDIFEINKSPINTLDNDYGFYHGVWSQDKTRFAYLSIQSLTVNQDLSLWSVDGVNTHLVKFEGSESTEYYDPIAWKDESTLILLGRKLLGTLGNSINIYEKNINDDRQPIMVKSLNIPSLSGRPFMLDEQNSFLGIDAVAKNAFVLSLKDYSVKQIPLKTTQDFTIQNEGILVNSLGYIEENQLQEFYESIFSTATTMAVTGRAQRPAPFLYWPVDTSFNALNYPDASPWRIALQKHTYDGHQGTDVMLSVGTPVYAAGAGSGRVAILYMGCPDLDPAHNNFPANQRIKNCINEVDPNSTDGLGYFNSGNVIILEYTVTVAGQSKNIYVLYGHLKQNSQPLGIYQGVTVFRGMHLAGSGHNGVSSASHLHFDVRYTLTQFIDWDDPWGDADAPHEEPDSGTMWLYQNGKITAAYQGTDRTGSVGGVVRNSSGQPVSGASVSAQAGGTSDTTDSNGYYTLQNVPEGSTIITARHNDGDGQTTLNVIAFTSQQVNITIYPVCLASVDNVNPLCYTPPTNDTTPPTGSWTNPGNGQTVSARSVTLSANASDNSGGSGVKEVRWSAKWGGNWYYLGNDTNSPYSMSWNMCSSGVPNGDVELGLEIWDNANNKWVYSSQYTNYHINKNYNCSQTSNDTFPPTGSWTSPSNNATINGSTVTLSANASDNSGGSGVKEVRWSAKWNNQWFGIGEDSSSPYSINWNMCSSGVPNGDIELGMEVWDNANNKWVYSQHYTNIHINKNYTCGGNDGGGGTTPGGSWTMQAWMNKYLAGYVNYNATVSWDNGNWPYIYFNWGNDGPAFPDYPNHDNEFSVRLWRNVYFPGGNYEFKVDADDAVRVYVDNQLVVDRWWDGSGTGDGSRNISAGNHEVKVEYYENQGDAKLSVVWYGPGYPRPDNNPPDGRITSPTHLSATTNTTLSIAADAWDDASGVDRVEFKAWYCYQSVCDWRQLSTDNTSPYTYDWNWGYLPDLHVWLTIHVYDKTGKVRYDPGGFVEVDLDRAKPTTPSITSPTANSYLNISQIPISATASDGQSGIWKVQFFAGYNETAGAGAQGEIASPLPFTPDELQEAASSEITAQDYWHEIGWDTDGTNGWNVTWNAALVPDQGGAALFIYTYDKAGNYQSAQVWPVMLDRVTPSSAVNALQQYTGSTSFTVNWTGTDATSGIASHDIQYQDNGGAWTNWLSATTSTSSTFNGALGHTYTFRSRARDRAGNVESWPASADAQTTIVTVPSNDNFGSAIQVTSVPYTHTIDTRGATTASNDPTPACGYGKNSNSVWYQYTAPANGLLEVDTWGSNYDTVLAIWRGSVGNLTLVDCIDDSYGDLEAWLEETPVTGGMTYYIEVMDYGNPGGGNLELYANFAASVSNNDFNTPTSINTMPYNISQDTRGATKANDDPALTACNRLPGKASVWYRITPSVNADLLLDTKGSDYDTMLAVWTGSRGSLVSVGCNDDINEVDGDSILTVPVTAGTTYYIEASTYAGRIDVNGASAGELQFNKDDVGDDDASINSLLEKKTDMDQNGGLITGLESERPDNISAQFWGGTLQLHLALDNIINPTFTDVPFTHMFWKYIEAFYDAGITTGCSQSPKKYCPLNNVTRGEMAVFVERAMGNYSPTPNPTGMFTDLPYPGLEFFTPFIEEFYNDGITTGCTMNPLKYCPQNYVTRGEMAVFIERALGNFTPTPNPTGMFADVPYAGQPASFQAFIEEFYNDGITTGCAVNPLKYCPQNKVTRQEMAVFIVRAFGIPLP
ncbi:MAG: S8 family serine peptidase [Chloroflexota bacterium]